VIRATLQFANDTKATRVVESTLFQLGTSPLWFPKEVHFVDTSDDETLIEDATVDVHEFNEHLDRSVFSLTTMDIPTGQVAIVESDTFTGPMMWDGNTLVHLPDTPARSAETPPSPSVRRILILNACVFGVLAIITMAYAVLKNAGRV
jgi:hypothetical protein